MVVASQLAPATSRDAAAVGDNLLLSFQHPIFLLGKGRGEGTLRPYLIYMLKSSAEQGWQAMAGKKILLVDDEPKVCDLIRAYLVKDGYEVITAADGKSALEQAQRHKPDLIVLDLNLPEIDGLEVCRNIRRDSDIPIIMLTARDDEVDKVVGLEIGADDYVTKPFSPRELAARVSAVLRRPREGVWAKEQVTAGNLRLDVEKHEVIFQGQQLNLTAAEFKILSVLARNPGRVYTRLQLMDSAFGESYEGYERTMDAHIKNIRQKISKAAPEAHNPLATVRGVGYKLEAK
jgi:DNA-binding response OmpR family regulator